MICWGHFDEGLLGKFIENFTWLMNKYKTHSSVYHFDKPFVNLILDVVLYLDEQSWFAAETRAPHQVKLLTCRHLTRPCFPIDTIIISDMSLNTTKAIISILSFFFFFCPTTKLKVQGQFSSRKINSFRYEAKLYFLVFAGAIKYSTDVFYAW